MLTEMLPGEYEVAEVDVIQCHIGEGGQRLYNIGLVECRTSMF